MRSRAPPSGIPSNLTFRLLSEVLSPDTPSSSSLPPGLPDTLPITDSALDLTSELIQHFVTEAIKRSALEAECDPSNIDDNEYEGGGKDQSQSQSQDPPSSASKTIHILPKHVMSVAAELLMEYS